MAEPEYIPPLRAKVLDEDGLFTSDWQRYFTHVVIPYLERINETEIDPFVEGSDGSGFTIELIEQVENFLLSQVVIPSSDLLQRIEELEIALLSQPYFHRVIPEGNLADNAIIRGDGGDNKVQDSGASVDDSGEVTAVGAHLGDDTDYTEIQAHGEIRLHGNARAWKSIDLDPARVKRPSGNPPAEDVIDAFEFHRYHRLTEESVYFHWGIPDDFASGSANVRVFFKFIVEKPSTTTDEVVIMGFEYKRLDEGDVFDFDSDTTDSYVAETIVQNETPWVIHRTEENSCSTSGWQPHDTVLFRFHRDTGDAADTYDSEAAADDNDVWVYSYHLQYLSDRIGSSYVTGEMWGADMWGPNMWGANMWSQAS